MNYEIVGGSLPAVVIRLNAGETVVSESGGRTWMKGNVQTESKSEGGLKKMLGRALSGESLFMSRYTAKGDAEIGFASSFPGSIIARELAAGQSIVCQKSAFLCATDGVELSVQFQKKMGSGFFGGEGFIMQKVTGPGTVFLEVDGYCHEYELAPGEKVVCDTGVVAIMDATCQMDVQMVKGVKNMLFGSEGLFDTVVTGPGRVYLQTMTINKLADLMVPFLPFKRTDD